MMKTQKKPIKLYWSVGSFLCEINGPNYWGVIWDAAGSEVWTGELKATPEEAREEATVKMKELMKNE